MESPDDVAPVATDVIASPPKATLADLLGSMFALHEILDDPSFDAASFVGASTLAEAERTAEAFALKVDAIDFVIRELEDYAKRTAPRVRNAREGAEKLRQYVLAEMQARRLPELKGNLRSITVRRASNPTVTTTREPGPADMLEYGGEFVREVPRKYEWRKDGIKAALKAGKRALDWARLEYSWSLKLDDRDRPAVRDRKAKEISK